MPKQLYRVRRCCAECDKDFTVYPSGKERKYCSQDCYWEHIRGRARMDPEDRFWLYVRKTEECWLWTGPTIIGGYGLLCFGSRVEGTCRSVRAHRYSWELHHGLIPEGIEVCHNCPGGDNPLCVKPAHLFLGSHKANMLDAQAKHRMARGTRNGHSKLTEADVQNLRLLHQEEGISQRAIGRRFGITHSNVRKILSGETWKHLPWPGGS